jgi:hypothetical protein
MMQLFNWFRRRSLERGLDRELQYHCDRRVADLIATGIPECEARRRVAVELGLTQVREEVRDVWLSRWFRDFLYDLRFSGRSFLRSPGFTAATLLSLALGIGATTAIYSLVDQIMLHALPVRDASRLVLVDWNGDQVVGGFGSWNLMSYPMCRDLQVLRRRPLPRRNRCESLLRRRSKTCCRRNRLRQLFPGPRHRGHSGPRHRRV